MQSSRNFDNSASSLCSSQHSNLDSRVSGHSTGVKGERVEFYNGNEAVICHCREECRIVTSWTVTNPGRRFHGCINYGVIFTINHDISLVYFDVLYNLLQLIAGINGHCRPQKPAIIFCGMIHLCNR